MTSSRTAPSIRVKLHLTAPRAARGASQAPAQLRDGIVLANSPRQAEHVEIGKAIAPHAVRDEAVAVLQEIAEVDGRGAFHMGQ